MNEFHFTDAEKEQIQHATHHAMSDTLRQLYPLFENVCGERIAKLEAENARLSAPIEMEEWCGVYSTMGSRSREQVNGILAARAALKEGEGAS